MVTLYPLDLGLSQDKAKEERARRNMSVSEKASFYTMEKQVVGPACEVVSWSTGKKDDIYAFVYTRVDQGTDEAVFLCCNPGCSLNARPQPATKEVTADGGTRCVINHCSSCSWTARSLRDRKRPNYREPGDREEF
jgi:hypothetical protein